MGNNSAGIKAKLDSFQNVINQLKPGVAMLQESKLYEKGTLKFNDYCVFEKVRNQNEGGGLVTLVHNNFEPIMVPRENEPKVSENILVVEAKLENNKVRFINVSSEPGGNMSLTWSQKGVKGSKLQQLCLTT